jgi:antitoxin component of MazEF toxin-antitoxin module
MRKKLSAIGNSLGIVIEKPILELLKIDRDTEMEVSTDGRRLILEPVESTEEFDALARRIMKEHAGTLRKLAK